jgi:ketosteroid isomerase-like protein
MKSFSIILAFLISVSIVNAQKNLTDEQIAVQQAISKVFDALSNRDSVSLKAHSTSDVSFLEYGQVWNLDTMILKAIKRNTAKDFKRVNTIEFINTSVDKNTAWAAYHLHSEFVREGKQSMSHWLETVVLVRENKKWKLKLLHSTLIKRT